VLDTYRPEEPDRFPAFLESRVYQGASGRVFPLPFHERISSQKQARTWKAIHLENDWIRVVVLPELGGRIYAAFDKVAGQDMFYRNDVIKPALVGLAGPWVSGGVEFNWPQHHRPATFLPTDVSIEREADGSVTVWCSDHDPFTRMKGMHGIRLSPESALIEARVRLYNRSDGRRSFLWWANAAVAVNDEYQSVFPQDVAYVADHARRAVVSYPRADRPYYGVDYPERARALGPGADRLDWYRNIPVPTSYMVPSSREEFFGGFDHAKQAGFIHWASSSVSPGKKQWTWGNEDFGRAWDDHLTDTDGPYVELMAGVYTDNQPDFAFLDPGETKTFSQFWYPVHIGPVQRATRTVAALLRQEDAGVAVEVEASVVLAGARVDVLDATGRSVHSWSGDLRPGTPWTASIAIADAAGVLLSVTHGGRSLLTLGGPADQGSSAEPRAATAPPAPSDVATIDELVQIATYLEQYHHATRSPEPYWQEVLARDASESRATAALGAVLYDRADYAGAIDLLERSVERRTEWAQTPADGEAHYRLGLALARAGRVPEAEARLARAAWDARFSAPASFALGQLQSRQGRVEHAIESLQRVLDVNHAHLQAAALLAIQLRRLGDETGATALLLGTLDRDPLDQWTRDLLGEQTSGDATVMLDVALEYAAAGCVEQALAALAAAERVLPELAQGQVNVGPLIGYHRAALLWGSGRDAEAETAAREAASRPWRHCLPSRLDDVDALQVALARRPDDHLAALLLGSWLYDRRRYPDAIDLWQRALLGEPHREIAVIAHRNLGIAAYNVTKNPLVAAEHYAAARQLDPEDPKLLYEADQLSARLGASPLERLAVLEPHADGVATRDDLTVAFAELHTDVGDPAGALALLTGRMFQPWEGGEGQVLAAWDRASLVLAREYLGNGDVHAARDILVSALRPPRNLGEARHPLSNLAELHLVAGDAAAAVGDQGSASAHWQESASYRGDFGAMAVRPFSAQTYFSMLALDRLGGGQAARALADELATWLETFSTTPATVDYFATSLPSMLLFIDDPMVDRDREVRIIRAQLDHWLVATE
jgi:tetratricopeptide (TPR) repeat protein